MHKLVKKSSEKVVAFGFGLAIVLLLSVAITSYLSLQNLRQNRTLVIRTYEVLETLHTIEHHMEHAVTSGQRYLLTNNPQQLDDYWAAIQTTKQTVEMARRLTRDNPTQQRHLEKLGDLIADRMALMEWETPFLSYVEAVQQVDAILQPIDATIAEMSLIEQTLLQQRLTNIDTGNRIVLVVISVGYSLSFCLLMGVYCLLRQQVRDRTQAEQNLQRANIQLGQMVQDAVVANAALKQEIVDRMQAELKLAQTSLALRHSNQELEQFAYVASHDLQEPLRAVTSYTQLLARNYQPMLDDKAGKYIHYIVDGATRMQQLINDLLEYSRVGKQALKLELTDCNAVLQDVLTTMQVAIADANGTITTDPLPTLMIDQNRFSQLLQNLIGNALKYHGDEPPNIHITAVPGEQDWVFSVQDNGIGMESQYLERIFVIFQRLHTRRHYSGTGIGLAICKRIVELHQGRIWVESQPGVGSTFYFTIPLPQSSLLLESP